MKLRPVVLLFSLPFLALPAACGGKMGATTQAPEPPQRVENLDGFEVVFNEYVRIPEETPTREAYRQVLLRYLLHYVDTTLHNRDEAEAISALQYAASLYTPGELRTVAAAPALARRARAVYALAARRGAEDPAFFTLAMAQRFGDPAARKRAIADWRVLERWIVQNGPYATEPLLRHEELEHALEQVAAVFPSPFVVKRLSDLYVARFQAARASTTKRQVIGTAAQRRMEVTGYLLMRLYLRADDFEGALAALERVELDLPGRKLKEILVDAIKPRRSALPLVSLAEQFVPAEDAALNQPFVMQGWAIVDNLSRRAVQQFPRDPYAHLLRARSLSHEGLTAASIVHLRRSIDLKEDIFEAWQALAELEQQQLQKLAEAAPREAARYLQQVETMHARAVDLWSDRPIQPGLPEAFYTVAEGLYHAGEVDEAEALLHKSVGIEPVPDSIDLLGTIALKRSKLSQAQSRYEKLARMAYDSELTQLRWEARARHQLGEIALRRGDPAGSTRHIRMALRHTNELLSQPATGVDERAQRYVERGKLLFLLGDVSLAMDDFHKAAELDPSNVPAYADPLRYVVAHGYYDEARDLYRRAMRRGQLSDELKLYFSLWVNELALRQEREPDADASSHLEQFVGTGWVQALARYGRGQLQFEELIARANDRGERAEAYFYEGLKRWRLGDIEQAKKLMHKVLDTEMMGFFEYDMALAYLEWGDLPRNARPPLVHSSQAETVPR